MLRTGVLILLYLWGGLCLVAGPAAAASPLKLPEWPVTPYSHGRTLLFSDAPEYAATEGILYEDVVKGKVRLFFHHVNTTPQPAYIGVVAESVDGAAASVRVERAGIAAPDPDYLRAGKQAQYEYLKAQAPYSVEVPAGKPVWLLPGPAATLIGTDELLTGMVDLSTDRDLRIRFVLKNKNTDLKRMLGTARILAPGEPHLRGKFSGSDRLFLPDKVYRPDRDGAIRITLADGVKDSFLRGFDAALRVETENYGNYGVVYQLLIPTEGPGKFRCRLYPRGGVYAGWNLLRYRQQDYLAAAPKAAGSFGDRGTDENEVLGEFEAGSVLWLRFSPPASSNLPVHVVLEPVL